jgi:hypothetical protein
VDARNVFGHLCYSVCNHRRQAPAKQWILAKRKMMSPPKDQHAPFKDEAHDEARRMPAISYGFDRRHALNPCYQYESNTRAVEVPPEEKVARTADHHRHIKPEGVRHPVPWRAYCHREADPSLSRAGEAASRCNGHDWHATGTPPLPLHGSTGFVTPEIPQMIDHPPCFGHNTPEEGTFQRHPFVSPNRLVANHVHCAVPIFNPASRGPQQPQHVYPCPGVANGFLPNGTTRGAHWERDTNRRNTPSESTHATGAQEKVTDEHRQRKDTRNEQARSRAAGLRRKAEGVSSRLRNESVSSNEKESIANVSSDVTPEELRFLENRNVQKIDKNFKSREREARKKAEVQRILSKPIHLRCSAEHAFVAENLAKKHRKNQGDRMRRLSQKEQQKELLKLHYSTQS